MKILSRSLLAKAFPNNPRVLAEMERLDDFLGETSGKAASVSDLLDGLLADLGDGGKYQKATALLETIANLQERIGAIEIGDSGEATVRPIDSQDPASLLTRGVAYTVLVGIAGKGATASRPTLPATALAIYLDTTLAAAGKPVFWTGTAWVDSSGAAV